jgi:hypothetical protein
MKKKLSLENEIKKVKKLNKSVQKEPLKFLDGFNIAELREKR